MTPTEIIVAAIPYTVQALVAVTLGTYAAYWTAHARAVERTRWIGARPLGAIPAEDRALRLRYAALRRAADRRAVA